MRRPVSSVTSAKSIDLCGVGRWLRRAETDLTLGENKAGKLSNLGSSRFPSAPPNRPPGPMAARPPGLLCQERVPVERGAVPEMKEGPSEPACRGRLQTAVSCFGPKGRGGERYGHKA
jgi:hypothetical protein